MFLDNESIFVPNIASNLATYLFISYYLYCIMYDSKTKNETVKYMVFTWSRIQRSSMSIIYVSKSIQFTVNFRYLEVVGTMLYKLELPEVH